MLIKEWKDVNMAKTNTSPDMICYADVIGILTACPKCFKDEKSLAEIIQYVNYYAPKGTWLPASSTTA